jgi:hypothetical protein
LEPKHPAQATSAFSNYGLSLLHFPVSGEWRHTG